MSLTRTKPAVPSESIATPLYEPRRTRGLVWVCDIAGSSRLLNKNETAATTEEFLQRFLYLSLLAVNSGGGAFVKWTGDGFLAFFETPLDRDLGATAETIFEGAFFLTLLVNVTQLGIDSRERIRIRHAVTYEKDALLIDLVHSGDMKSKELLGRSVVTAFRLSAIHCDFPGIVTHREVLKAFDDADIVMRENFKAFPISAEMKLRYFKGEHYGTRDVFVSTDKQAKKRSFASARRFAEDVLRNAESQPGSQKNSNGRLLQFRKAFSEGLRDGPEWLGSVMKTTVKEFVLPAMDALRVISKVDSKNPRPRRR